MCVDGQSMELFAEDNDREDRGAEGEVQEDSKLSPIEIEEFHLAEEAVKYKRMPSWNLSGHIDWEDEAQRY